MLVAHWVQAKVFCKLRLRSWGESPVHLGAGPTCGGAETFYVVDHSKNSIFANFPRGHVVGKEVCLYCNGARQLVADFNGHGAVCPLCREPVESTSRVFD